MRGMIIDSVDNDLITMHPDNNGFGIKIKRQRYKPEFVYKALQKMALSVMPDEDFYKCLKTAVYMKISVDESVPEDYRNEILSSDSNIGFLEFIPGNNPFNGVGVKLFRKKADGNSENHVEYIFKVQFGNFSLQVPISTDEQIHNDTLKMIPHLGSADLAIQNLNFNNVDSEFHCDFSAVKRELNDIDIKEVEKMLREKGLMGKSTNQ